MLMFSSIAARAEILADTIYAVTPEHINNKNIKINQTINLLVFNIEKCSTDICFSEGENIYVRIKRYVKPKRGKRDGYYKIEYKTMEGKMSASSPKDLQSLAKKAGIVIAGQILKIPGFSQAVAVSKGLIKPNENETRLESAGKNLYESTPLTYVEKGKDFNVEADGIVVLKLKEKNKK